MACETNAELRKRIADLQAHASHLETQNSKLTNVLSELEAHNVELKEDLSVARSSLYEVVGQRNALIATQSDLEKARKEIERLREALVPSADTRNAYIQQFTIPWEGRTLNVPWVTIMDIMKTILERAQSKIASNGP